MSGKAEAGGFGNPELDEQIGRLEKCQADLHATLDMCVRTLAEIAAVGNAEIHPSIASSSSLQYHQRLQSEIRGLQSRLDSLEGRCASVTELAAVNTARIDEILRSRIWRTLASAGRLLLKISGK